MRLAPSLTALVGLALVGSCGEGNPGFDPPADQMWFPSGVLLDPRIDPAPIGPCESDADCDDGQLCGAGQCRASARWMLVTNANSDRRYNAGSLMVVDLDAFFEAALGDPTAVKPAGSRLSTSEPCRRVANLPQVVECMEEPFVQADATIHFGNFPGPATGWDQDPGDDEAMVLIPVRGDPSITYAELSGFEAGDIEFECGQASDADGRRMCDDDHRLRFLRNDPSSERLAREPFRVLVSPQDDLPLAYVSHQGDPDLTLIALEGVHPVEGEEDEKRPPAIVHQAGVLTIDASSSFQGGFGLAQRPCVPGGDNVPASSLDCTRPLVYSALRWAPQLLAFTAVSHEPEPGEGDDDYVCVGPEGLGTIGGIICDPQVQPLSRIGLTGLPIGAANIGISRAVLADIAFSRTGNELYVLQSNPGGLIRVDTSLGPDGEPLDADVGTVEVCSQPTTFVIYDDGLNEYGIVSCYRSGEVFIIDLAALTVVGLSRAGIGPDPLVVDVAREVVYVANTLDATISIIDMSPTSSSRFNEIARIGLQEPYTQ